MRRVRQALWLLFQSAIVGGVMYWDFTAHIPSRPAIALIAGMICAVTATGAVNALVLLGQWLRGKLTLVLPGQTRDAGPGHHGDAPTDARRLLETVVRKS